MKRGKAIIASALAAMAVALFFLARAPTRTSRARYGMKALDRILELLQDAQPHSLDEIKAQIPLPAEKLALVLDFLVEPEFIKLKGENTEAMITPLGLSFLELPSKALSTKNF